MKYILIGIGGAIGAISRYALQGIVYQFAGTGFPYGTLAVNIIGCFLIGLFMELTENRYFVDPQLRIFITVGILGGFTTFSTFGYETFSLLRDGEFMRASYNIISSVLIGLTAVWLGFITARII
ncbi:fluoride efflux transporter CrcB [bacterium]|nr:MAG: fluoride efflux transporter CrcB [bacterium]